MINKYNLKGNYLESFPTIAAAAKSFGEDWRKKYPVIYTVCRKSNGSNKSAYGFLWKETEDISDISPYKKNRRNTGGKKVLKVYQFDKNGIYLQTFESVRAASEATNIKSKCIYTACYQKGLAGDFMWRLVPKNAPEAEPENIAPYVRKRPIPLTHGGGCKPKSVRQYDFHGKYLRTYDCIKTASKENNVSSSTIVCSCKHKKLGRGFYWMWADETDESDIVIAEGVTRKTGTEEPSAEKPKAVRGKPVNQYDLNGHFIQSFSSIKAAAESVGVTTSYIFHACATCCPAKQYLWKRSNDTKDIAPYLKKSKVNTKQTNQYDQNGNFLRSFASIKEAALSVGASLNQISRADRLENCIVKGFMWRVTEDTSDIEPYIPKKRGKYA